MGEVDACQTGEHGADTGQRHAMSFMGFFVLLFFLIKFWANIHKT